MAKTTYRVKKSDTFANLGYPASTLMQLNPGVARLSQGQTIFVPGQVKAGSKNTTPSTPNLATYNNSPYRGFQTPTSSTQYVPQFAGSQVQAGAKKTPTSTPVALQNPAGLPVMDGMTQTTSQVYTNAGINNQQGVIPPRPAGVYTGDPNDPNTQLWKNYWNASAANPAAARAATANSGGGGGGGNNAPVVMTRNEIWEMKARSRRRKMAKGEGENVSNAPVAPKVIKPTLGNEQNQNVSWRV
jgi:hypothetical protein